MFGIAGVDATQHAEGDEAFEQQGTVHLGERRHLLVRGLGVNDRDVRGRSRVDQCEVISFVAALLDDFGGGVDDLTARIFKSIVMSFNML